MRIGEVRVRLLRVMQYASIITMVASVATAVKVGAFPLWSVLLGLPLVIVAFLLDSRLVQGENAYFNRNNQDLQKLIKAVERLEKK